MIRFNVDTLCISNCQNRMILIKILIDLTILQA